MRKKLILLTFISHHAITTEAQKQDPISMNQLEKAVISLYGETGKQWLADLPQLTQNLATRWGLSDLQPVEGMCYNYVLSGFRGEQPIILKIGLDPQEPGEELYALQALANPSLVKVLEHDLGLGAFLLERAVPGTTMHECFPEQDLESLKTVCNLIKGFPRIVASEPPIFDLHEKWFSVLDEESPIPQNYVAKARVLEKLLIATAPQPLVLCHADLHHGNILKDGNRWIAIDPFPAFAEPAFEVAHFMWNPYRLLPGTPHVYELLKQRMLFAAQELAVDKERIERWTFVKVVTMWGWSFKSGRDVTKIKQLVKLLDAVTPDNLETPSPLWEIKL